MRSTATKPTLHFSTTPRVNLLPRSERNRRATAALARRWVGLLFGAVVLAAAVVGGAYAYSMMNTSRLTAVQAQTTDLLVQLGELKPVSDAISTRSALSAQREEAMSGDIDWAPIVTRLASVLPGDSALTGYALTAGGSAPGADPQTQVGMLATLTISAGRPVDAARTAGALRAVDGVTRVEVVRLGAENERYTANVILTLDQTIYTGKYSPHTGEQTSADQE